MQTLLTAKDIEVKIFKKAVVGGYVIAEVEDFLNQVADDLELYSLRLLEHENKIQDMEESLNKYESIKEMLKDALVMAQKSAKATEEEARSQAEEAITEAQNEASKILESADLERKEVLRRFAEIENDVAIVLNDAHEKAAFIVAEAKVKEKEIIERAQVYFNEQKYAFENLQNDFKNLQDEKEKFLKNTKALLADFNQLLEKVTEEDFNSELYAGNNQSDLKSSLKSGANSEPANSDEADDKSTY